MSKFVLNIRHRPALDEAIEERFLQFRRIASALPPPWCLAREQEIKLPPVGTALSTHLKLRGKLGRGISGDLKFQYRAPTNLDDRAADDDAVVLEFDESRASWWDFAGVAFPGLVKAMAAYIGHVYRWDEAPQEWRILKSVARDSGADLDGRDGFFRFGPINFMDRELCRRGCNGMSPEQVADALKGVVTEVRIFEDGVLIVAADHFPEQSEIVATDRVIRERLKLPIWGSGAEGQAGAQAQV